MTWSLLLALGVLADSTSPFPFEELRRAIVAHHPIVQQARWLEAGARGAERAASGAFDPRLSLDWSRKSYNGIRAYDYLDLSLTVPTPLGIDVVTAFDRTQGASASPDLRTPTSGLVYAGVRIPVGQRLLADERRATLAQARAMQEWTAAERAAIVNRVLASAARTYASWYEGWRREEITESAVRLAEERLRGIRGRVGAGDAAPIDTVEAALEVQRRLVLLAEATLSRENARLAIEAMFWGPGGSPRVLDPRAVPTVDGLSTNVAVTDSLAEWIAEASVTHPESRKAAARVLETEAKRELASRTRFVPDAKVSAGRLIGGAAVAAGEFPAGDYKTTATLTLPVLQRKVLGAFDEARASAERAILGEAVARRDVAVAIAAAANTIRALGAAEQLQRVTVTQARELRTAEERKFRAGESTLFLVNARERVVLDEELKEASLKARLVGARAELAASLGREP